MFRKLFMLGLFVFLSTVSAESNNNEYKVAGVNLGDNALNSKDIKILSKELVALKIKGVSICRQLGIVHHRKHTSSNAAKAIIETLHNYKQ